MAITIKGIRIEGVSLKADAENGGHKIESAQYALISSADRVLAKQSIGGYNDVKLEPSADTVKLLQQFVESYSRDVKNVLGLEL